MWNSVASRAFKSPIWSAGEGEELWTDFHREGETPCLRQIIHKRGYFSTIGGELSTKGRARISGFMGGDLLDMGGEVGGDN